MTGVSVIIATYDRGPLLEEALASVLSQTYTNYEIIVADDGSNDDTAARLERYGNRIKVLRLSHSGRPSVARNAAIRAATGKYLAFLDSDDAWMPEDLERQVGLLEQHSSFVMSYCDAVFVGQNGEEITRQSKIERLRRGRVFGDLLLGNFIPLPTVVARREKVVEAGAFAEWLTMGEDWHLWLKLSAGGEVGFVSAPLCRIRLHENAITKNRMLLFSDAVRVLEDVERRFPGEYEKSRGKGRRGMAKMLCMLGRNYLFAGETGEARRLFCRALHNFPLGVDVIPFLILALLGRRAVLGLRSFKKRSW